MKRGRVSIGVRIAAVAAMAGCLGGCKLYNQFANSRTADYQLVSEEFATDANGRRVRISHWVYEDGAKTTTTEPVGPDGSVEQRRTGAPTHIIFGHADD
jgi:hypothetical protein